jgi:hypothetical protein
MGLSFQYVTKPSVASGDEKYAGDPYWTLFKESANSDSKNRVYFADGEQMTAFSRNPFKKNSPLEYSEAAFAKFVSDREFFDAMDARAQAVNDKKSSVFDREGAPPGAGSSARDVGSFTTVTRDSFSKANSGAGMSGNMREVRNKKLDSIISKYGSDPYFAEYLAESKRNNSSVFKKSKPSKSFAAMAAGGAFDFDAYVNFVNKKAAADRAAARIEAANPVIDEITQDGGGGFPLDSANADGDVITSLTGAQIEAAFLDPNIELIQDDSGSYIGYRSTQGQTEVADTTGTGTLSEVADTNVAQGLSADEVAVADTTGTGTIGELTGGNTATGAGAVDEIAQTSAPGSTQGTNVFKNFVKDEAKQRYEEQLAAEAAANNARLPIDGIFYNDAGEITGFETEADRAKYNTAQNPTINVAGSLYDYDGNFVGADPNTINVGGSLYDRQGNYLGPAQVGATGETVGGASSDNVIFDAYTAEQEAAQAKASEAVELMDAGYGRYNAAIRKLGIVGRQGEEYAPLILDQLRMAEQEAAQPQLAAFGFGLNPQLGGMPQIGVQGVQGNTGGQSALTAMSNAGLNQLQLAQQPYNRIALPAIDSTTGQPDFSQVNNPTIFKASTGV